MGLSHWCSGRVNEAVHRMRINLTIHLDVTICLSLHEPRLFHFGGVRQHSREHAMNIIMDLTKLRRRRTENVKKTIGLMSKTTTLHVHHAFLYISLLSLHNNDVTWPHFKFTWERERRGDKFYHLCLNLGAAPTLQLQPKFPSFKLQGEFG